MPVNDASADRDALLVIGGGMGDVGLINSIDDFLAPNRTLFKAHAIFNENEFFPAKTTNKIAFS